MELTRRVDELETFLSTTEQPCAKRCRVGGDRSCFFPIRKVDMASRGEWCFPGGVFGLYSDGVGRLLPVEACPRRSIVVYSTDPDTEEAHPNPSQPNSYVRVVMVCAPLFSPLLDHLTSSRLVKLQSN